MLEANRLLRLTEVAELFGCSKRHVFTLIEQGRLRAINLSSRATRIAASEVERFVAENAKSNVPAPSPDSL